MPLVSGVAARLAERRIARQRQHAEAERHRAACVPCEDAATAAHKANAQMEQYRRQLDGDTST
jgi:hypothetical protein